MGVLSAEEKEITRKGKKSDMKAGSATFIPPGRSIIANKQRAKSTKNCLGKLGTLMKKFNKISAELKDNFDYVDSSFEFKDGKLSIGISADNLPR